MTGKVQIPKSANREVRCVLKAGHREVYERIMHTLAGMVNRHSDVVVVPMQTLVLACKAQFSEHDRPTVGEVCDAIIYLHHAKRIERLHRHVSDEEGLFRVRIVKGIDE